MKIAGIVVAAVVSACFLGLVQNGTAPAAEGSGTKAAPSMTATNSQTLCPVLGGKIGKEAYADYKGKRVYFCCPDCIAKFNKAPDKYMKKLAEQGVAPENTPAKKEAGAKVEGSGTKPTPPEGSATKNEGSGTK